MRNIGRHIIIFLAILTTFGKLAAQDSTRRQPTAAPTPPAQTSAGASVGNPNLTVPPIILPADRPRKPRRRRLTAADSMRLVAQRDSLAKVAATANSSIFNTGAANFSPNSAMVDSTAKMAPMNVSKVPILETSPNPFDILRGAPKADSTANAVKKMNYVTAAPSLLNRQSYSKKFLLWIFLFTLILMAFVVGNARLAVNNAYGALLNNNALRQIYREQMGWGSIPQLALYGLFWQNAGIFVFLMLYYFDVKSSFDGQLASFMACIGGVSLIFLVKHLILYIIASIFPIAKEIKTYNYIIITAGILLGLVLLPINIFIAYAPVSMSNLFVYIGFAAIGSMYLIRSLRSLSVASPFLITDQFHFLLYICVVEVAPVMILIKMVTHNSSIFYR